MRRERFATNYVYHIYNRGVDKRNIFTDDRDRIRFIRNLLEFNDQNPALHHYYKSNFPEVQPREKPREKIVEILAYCLMPNHYHLFVRQVTDDGAALFMQKLGTGYTMYFNQRYERNGALFQGRFKSIFVEHDVHFRYLPHYIHLNPLDLTMPSWRNNRIHKDKAMKDIQNFQWSSIHDYLGQSKFPGIVSTDLITELYPRGYIKELSDYLSDRDIPRLGDLTLE